MAGQKQCHDTFDSFYDKSSLNLLYGGMRKNLFVDTHPLGGLSAANVALKVGKSSFDLKEQQLEYKEKGWRVKANFGGTNLFNLKRKIGIKTKGQTRNNIQFGTDESHFGSDNEESKFSVGGMFTFGGIGGILATTRLKVFSDQAAEVFADASLGDAKLGCDLRASSDGAYKGYFGASYCLPSSIPVLKNAHVGSVMAFDGTLSAKSSLRPSFGFFTEAPVPSVQKAVIGMELFTEPQAILFGAELAIDSENSVVMKAGDNGIAQISLVKQFKGIDLRMGAEANLAEGSFGNFGAEVVLKQ